MNYARFLNAVSLARQPSPIRVLTALVSRSGPSMISLAGGMPNPDMFPFQEAEFKLRDGTVLRLSEDRMKVALQYGPTNGVADLIKFLRDLQKSLHSPPNFDWKPEAGGIDICVTPGSQDGLLKSFEMLISPGDQVIVDSPTYSGAICALRPLGCKMLAIETDEFGMIPSSLQATLSKCEAAEDGTKEKGSNMPKFLYTIPNGVNPTGASLNVERKRDIYKIARKYDLLILEDDPYYFLQFNKTRIPSFLSMDEDGRVLRFDSFSKIISSGLRVGFVTGPAPLVERIVLHLMVSTMHSSSISQEKALIFAVRKPHTLTSPRPRDHGRPQIFCRGEGKTQQSQLNLRVGYVTGPWPLVYRIVLHSMVSAVHPAAISQIMMSDLLNRWGLDGFESHVQIVAEFYRKQKDLMIAAANKWLKDLAEWDEPQAGMFLWMKLKGINDTKILIEEKAQKKEVLLVPGYNFMPDPSVPSSYVRASFSIASAEQMDKGFQRLADLIREELSEQKN